MTQILAWHSGTWWVNDGWHALGAFVTSSGAAGFAAVTAAIIAAIQVTRTRNSDTQHHLDVQESTNKQQKREALWQRFEWVVQNSVAGKDGAEPLFKPETTIQLLASLRDSAYTRAIGLSPADAVDPRLADLIGTTLSQFVVSAGQKAGL